jgi:hypothetical protein
MSVLESVSHFASRSRDIRPKRSPCFRQQRKRSPNACGSYAVAVQRPSSLCRFQLADIVSVAEIAGRHRRIPWRREIRTSCPLVGVNSEEDRRKIHPQKKLERGSAAPFPGRLTRNWAASAGLKEKTIPQQGAPILTDSVRALVRNCCPVGSVWLQNCEWGSPKGAGRS